MTQLTCFKAYDIRGELGEELNEDIAYRIGRAYGEFLKPGKIVVGDVRLTSESLKLALARGLMDAGTDVLDIGLSGTEEIYFATFHLGVDGGIEVTASHNPMNYNGMKLVRENAKPISGDTGLRDIQRLAEENQFPPVDPARRGTLRQISVLKEYVDHLMGYVDLANFTRPLKLVVNSGNGAAGHVIDEVEKRFAAAGVPVTLSRCITSRITISLTVSLIRCCRSAARIPPTRCASIRPTWGLPLTATSIAASCSMTKLRLSRGITLSACWLRRSCRSSRERKSFTTRA